MRVRVPLWAPTHFLGVFELLGRLIGGAMGNLRWSWLVIVMLWAAVGCAPSVVPETPARPSSDVVAEPTGIDLLDLSDATRSAIAEARAELPEFWTAWEESGWGKGDYIVNVQFNDQSGGGEFLWMSVEARGEGEVTGVIEGVPTGDVGVKTGERVTVKESDVVDWMFLPEEGDFRGGFTLKALGSEAE